MAETVLLVDAADLHIVASAAIAPSSLFEPGLTLDVARLEYEGRFLAVYLVRSQWPQLYPGCCLTLFSAVMFACPPEAWDTEMEALLQRHVVANAPRYASQVNNLRRRLLARFAGIEG